MSKIGITITAVDQASEVMKRVASNISESMDTVKRSTDEAAKSQQEMQRTSDEMNRGLRDVVVGFSGVATGAFALYGAFDRMLDTQVSVSRANLQVQTTLKSVEDAQKRYNATVEKYGLESEAASDAAKELNLAQERYSVAVDRAEMMQGNLNQSMVHFAVAIIPSAITMIDSIIRAKQAWAAAQAALNAVMAANPIMLVVVAIGALVAALTAAYYLFEPFRNAVNAVGEALGKIGQTILIGWRAITGTLKTEAENQVKIVEENLQKQLQTIDAKYRDVRKTVDSRQKEIEKKIQDHWLDVFRSTKKGWDAVYESCEEFYAKELGSVSSWLDERLKEVQAGYNETTEIIRAAYASQVDATGKYYDALVEKINEGLAKIRGTRTKELANLEETFLRQKRILDIQYQRGEISKEEYESTLRKIEELYNAERTRISEAYRLQELEYERLHGEELARLEIEKRAKIEQLRIEENTRLEALQKEQNAKEEELRLEAAKRTEKIEADKYATLEKIRADQAALKQQFESEISAIEAGYAEERKAALLAAEIEKHNILETMREQEKTSYTAFYTGLIEQERAFAEESLRIYQNLKEELVGRSVWTDMLEGMTSQTEKSLGEISSLFQGLAPDLSTSIMDVAARIVGNQLRNVLVEASSSSAPGTHKRIRLGTVI